MPLDTTSSPTGFLGRVLNQTQTSCWRCHFILLLIPLLRFVPGMKLWWGSETIGKRRVWGLNPQVRISPIPGRAVRARLHPLMCRAVVCCLTDERGTVLRCCLPVPLWWSEACRALRFCNPEQHTLMRTVFSVSGQYSSTTDSVGSGQEPACCCLFTRDVQDQMVVNLFPQAGFLTQGGCA